MNKFKEAFLNYITLFSSMSTLICCALPSLLVSLGLGAVMAGLASNIPALVWASENKSILFLGAGFLLTMNGLLLWKNRNAPCPIDPKLRDSCTKGRRFSKNIYLGSLAIFSIGLFFAYLAPIVFRN